MVFCLLATQLLVASVPVTNPFPRCGRGSYLRRRSSTGRCPEPAKPRVLQSVACGRPGTLYQHTAGCSIWRYVEGQGYLGVWVYPWLEAFDLRDGQLLTSRTLAEVEESLVRNFSSGYGPFAAMCFLEWLTLRKVWEPSSTYVTITAMTANPKKTQKRRKCEIERRARHVDPKALTSAVGPSRRRRAHLKKN